MYGPLRPHEEPNALKASKRDIGPTMPPGFKSQNEQDRPIPQGSINTEETDDYGPSLPPGFKREVDSEQVTLGSILPPFSLSDSDNDSDDVGPMPLPSNISAEV